MRIATRRVFVCQKMALWPYNDHIKIEFAAHFAEITIKIQWQDINKLLSGDDSIKVKATFGSGDFDADFQICSMGKVRLFSVSPLTEIEVLFPATIEGYLEQNLRQMLDEKFPPEYLITTQDLGQN